METSDTSPAKTTPPIAPAAMDAVHWFVDQAKKSFAENLVRVIVYGPSVTEIFDVRKHRIHFLLILAHRNFDQLLEFAKHSKRAASKRISPPLVMTEDSVKQSRDVFPLEWIDIYQFHRTIVGSSIGNKLAVESNWVRLQCERDLRSLDIHLQQGILASGGEESRIRRLEGDFADSLVRVLRGVSWLSGDRTGLLPNELIDRCIEITKIELRGCSEAIKQDGQHPAELVKSMLVEVAALSDWIDAQQVESGR